MIRDVDLYQPADDQTGANTAYWTAENKPDDRSVDSTRRLALPHQIAPWIGSDHFVPRQIVERAVAVRITGTALVDP